MTTTFCQSGAVIIKAGANMNSTLKAGGVFSDFAETTYAIDHWINQAESLINVLTKYNWITDYSTYSDDVKKILEDAASCYAAIYCINYDKDGYSRLAGAEDTLNFLRDNFNRLIGILRIKQHQRMITNPTEGSV